MKRRSKEVNMLFGRSLKDDKMKKSLYQVMIQSKRCQNAGNSKTKSFKEKYFILLLMANCHSISNYMEFMSMIFLLFE